MASFSGSFVIHAMEPTDHVIEGFRTASVGVSDSPHAEVNTIETPIRGAYPGSTQVTKDCCHRHSGCSLILPSSTPFVTDLGSCFVFHKCLVNGRSRA